jgi:hypothetical protein
VSGRLRTKAAVAGVATAALAVVYLRRVEPWFRRWGATDEEVGGSFPVDDLVEPGAKRTTRAITVDAPLHEVWPWLVQIGQDRAGFYSYTWLENLVGAEMRNTAMVHPEWQERFTGDSVWLASQRRYGDRGRQVAALVKVMHALVLVSPEDWDRLQRGERARGAWGFFLEPRGDDTTRFVIRSSGGPVGTHLFDAIHFLMEQKMMRGLRHRAERCAPPERDFRPC